MLERCAGRGGAAETPIGFLPREQDLNLAGLDVGKDDLAELLSVDRALWGREAAELSAYIDEFGDRVPAALRVEVAALQKRLA
jgi:phosphoenolpyruvate carboxykinase (GTP)